MIQTFDKQRLTKNLESLSARARIAFAAACAQRLAPTFRVGEEAWNWSGLSAHMREILNQCWSLAQNPDDEAARVGLAAIDVTDRVPDADDSDLGGYRLFVFPPIGTLEPAISCAINPTAERAAYTAQREYDAAFGIADWGLPASSVWKGIAAEEAIAAGEQRLQRQRSHQIVQSCLRFQQESLEFVTKVDLADHQLLSSLQRKADDDGQTFLKIAMELYPRREPTIS
jgi:hypothetical protein